MLQVVDSEYLPLAVVVEFCEVRRVQRVIEQKTEQRRLGTKWKKGLVSLGSARLTCRWFCLRFEEDPLFCEDLGEYFSEFPSVPCDETVCEPLLN
jgi:hypothetical protein